MCCLPPDELKFTLQMVYTCLLLYGITWISQTYFASNIEDNRCWRSHSCSIVISILHRQAKEQVYKREHQHLIINTNVVIYGLITCSLLKIALSHLNVHLFKPNLFISHYLVILTSWLFDDSSAKASTFSFLCIPTWPGI